MQLNLNFQSNQNKNIYNQEEFLLFPENSKAFSFLQEFFTQNNFIKSNYHSLILKGAESCGKTHLAHIFADKFDAIFLQYNEVIDLNLSRLFESNKFYIVENIDEIQDQNFLFHLLNSVAEAKAFLLLTVKTLENFTLKDLNSRLKNIFTVEIKNPSIETMQQLLVSAFARRQMKLSNKIINFIADNIDRKYRAIYDIVKLVEEENTRLGKKITFREIKNLILTVNK